MPEYRLTNAAVQDLVEIARYGDEQFGVAASNAFRERLRLRFDQIAEQPLLYPRVDHIREGYRRSVVKGLSIFYRVELEHVVIVRLIGRQNPTISEGDEV